MRKKNQIKIDDITVFEVTIGELKPKGGQIHAINIALDPLWV